MKYSMNPLRYIPFFADLYTLLDSLRFQKQLLKSAYNLYRTGHGCLLMATPEYAKEILRR